MAYYRDGGDVEEVEVELPVHDANLVRRLVSEGWFESEEDAVSYALDLSIRARNVDTGYEADPRLQWRIEKLLDISSTAENDLVARFFADTTYLIQEYIRHLYEEGRVEKEEEVNGCMAGVDNILDPGRDPRDVEELLDGLEHYVKDFESRVSEDTVQAAVIDDYQDKYFPLDRMKPVLVG